MGFRNLLNTNTLADDEAMNIVVEEWRKMDIVIIICCHNERNMNWYFFETQKQYRKTWNDRFLGILIYIF
jgi:hypothetical protein